MPIYHTPTQEAYDALMEDLEKQGYLWASGALPTASHNWGVHRKQTCINVNVIDKALSYAVKGWYDSLNPGTYGETTLYIQEKEGVEDTAGCEVCLKGKPMVSYSNSSTKLTLEGREVDIEHFDDIYSEQTDYMEINYCPMCGTKLKGEESDE